MEAEVDDAVAADAHARRNHRLLADQGDTRVQVLREFSVDHIQAVAVTDPRTGADVHPLVEDGQVDHRVFLDHRIGEDHRVGHRGPLFHLHTRREHRVDHRALDDAARGNHGRGHPGTVQEPGRGPVHGPAAVIRVGADLPFLGRDAGIRADDVHVRFPVGLDGAHVPPVAVERVGEHAVLLDRPRDDVHAEVDLLAVLGQRAQQVLGVEHVDAHGGQVGARHLGLFLPVDDAVVGVDDARAELVDVALGHHHHADGDVRLLVLVVGDHGVEVHPVDVVAAEDDHLLGRVVLDEVDVLADGVRRALVPVRVLFAGARRQDLDPAGAAGEIPGLAVADMGHE